MLNKNQISFIKLRYKQIVYSFDKDEYNKSKKKFEAKMLYQILFAFGDPYPTPYISQNAMKQRRNGKNPCRDHFLKPQKHFDMMLDNPKKWFGKDLFSKFLKRFKLLTSTTKVSSEENRKLRHQIDVPLNQSYKEANILLFNKSDFMEEGFFPVDVPKDFQKYEKKFLVDKNILFKEVL